MLALLRSYFHTLKTYVRWIILGLILIGIANLIAHFIVAKVSSLRFISGSIVNILLLSGVSVYFFPLHRAYVEQASQWLEDFRKNREPTRFELFKKWFILTFLVNPLWSLLFITLINAPLLIWNTASFIFLQNHTLDSLFFYVFNFNLSRIILDLLARFPDYIFKAIPTYINYGALNFIFIPTSIIFFTLTIFPFSTYPFSVQEKTSEGILPTPMQLFKKSLIIRLIYSLLISGLVYPVFFMFTPLAIFILR